MRDRPGKRLTDTMTLCFDAASTPGATLRTLACLDARPARRCRVFLRAVAPAGDAAP